MTNEELNTALYEKMFSEQETYRAWLLTARGESCSAMGLCVPGHADPIYFCPTGMAGKPPERAGDLYRIKNSGIQKGYSHSKVFGRVPARGKAIFQICLCDFKS